MRHVKVWDLSTRVFHWLLVILIFSAWFTIENRMIDWHERIGHALLGLIVFRLFWGFFGSTTAQFRHFISNPFSALRYLKASLSLRSKHSTGHNPAGAWMVVLMLLVIGFQVGSGMYANDDLGFSGALSDFVSKATSDTLTKLHAFNFSILVGLIWIHLVAVFFYVLVKNENLVRAMFSGKKPEDQINPDDTLKFKSVYLSAAGLVLSMGFGFWMML